MDERKSAELYFTASDIRRKAAEQDARQIYGEVLNAENAAE